MGQPIIFGYETYVSTTGSDTTGNGTPGLPYRTLAKGFEDLAGASQLPTKPFQYYQLKMWVAPGVYAENIVSASQPFPGDPSSGAIPPGTSFLDSSIESVEIREYPQGSGNITIRPSSGVNVLNLTENNSGSAQGPSCFVQFHNTIFDGVNISGTVVIFGTDCHHNRLHQCQVINGPGVGIELQTGTLDNEIKLSIIKDNGGNGISDLGDNLIQDNNVDDNLADGVDTTGTSTIERNRLFNNINGIDCSGDALIRNNLSYDNSLHGINASIGKIYNNTLYSNSNSGVNASGSADPKNNICYLNGTNSIGSGSNNLDTGVNPMFVNASTFDFHLLSTSPAIDTGTLLTDVPADADLNLRPAGLTYDIGAYEYPHSAPSAVTTINGNMAIAQGRACNSPMDYRDIQATFKSGSGNPITGIALCVDAASTPSSFTGYVFMIDPAHATYRLKMEKYVNQPLTGLGTQLTITAGGGTLSASIGKLFTMMVGSNTLNANNNLMANRYGAGGINLFSNDTAISRANLGYGIVGIGNTVSIVQSGDDITVTTENGTGVWTSLHAGCMNSLTNIAAFEETFHFNSDISFNKSNAFPPWNNYGIQSPIDIDIRSHCSGNDCYGALWNFVYDYGEINPQPEDTWGDGLEIEFQYGGIVQGTPRTGMGFMLRSGFTNVLATIYGVVIDEIDRTIKLVRWEDQSLQTYGTILASVPYTMARGYKVLIWLINSGSIRAAGDPAEIYVWVDQTGTSTYGTEIIHYIDSTPFGQIAEAPNELMRWANTSAGFISVGTQSNNDYDIANYMGYVSIDQLL